MANQLTLDELKAMHGQPVWCQIPSDNPAWGIVDVPSGGVVLGLVYHLSFQYYGEWKAFRQPKAKDMEALQRETLDKCQAYYDAVADWLPMRGYIWLKNDETGQLMLYTRGEYTEQIMAAVNGIQEKEEEPTNEKPKSIEDFFDQVIYPDFKSVIIKEIEEQFRKIGGTPIDGLDIGYHYRLDAWTARFIRQMIGRGGPNGDTSC